MYLICVVSQWFTEVEQSSSRGLKNARALVEKYVDINRDYVENVLLL